MVVVPATATADELGAADMVAYQLGRVNGTAYSVVTDDAVPDDGYLISIGDTALAADVDTVALSSFGRSLSRSGRCLRVVAGSQPEAIWGAADLFLDRCGIRHHGPDPLWVSTPKRFSSLPSGDVSEVPDLGHFTMSNIWKPNTLPYQTYKFWGRRSMEHDSHSFGRLLTEQSFIDYPDITPTYDGVDTVPTAEQIASCSGWQPCMHFAETLADALMPAILTSLETYNDVQVSINDMGGYCECDLCAADAVAAGGSLSGWWTESIPGYSAQYHALLTEIRARLNATNPTARVVGLAYAQVAGSPTAPLADGIDLLNTVERPISTNSVEPDYANRVAAWSALAGWSVYDRMHGWDMVHPSIMTTHLKDCFTANPPRHLVMEGSPSWGLMLAQPYILSRLSWNLGVSVPGLWRQWATDLFGAASQHMLNYVEALEALTWTAADPPPTWDSYRSQLAPGTGQIDAVDAASAALSAAQATDGLDSDTQARLAIIAAAWDVPATLIAWANSETPPSAEDEAAFWTRFAAVEADNRTLWRTSVDDLLAGVAQAVDFTARRLSEYDWPVIYSEANPSTGEFVNLDGVGPSWRMDWTTTRGATPGRARINLRPELGDDYLVAGRWRAETWQLLVYIGDADPNYQECSVDRATVECSLVVTADRWRFFVDGRQVLGADEPVITPTRYFIETTGDEHVTDLIVRSAE